jgi:hypothetical protein
MPFRAFFLNVSLRIPINVATSLFVRKNLKLLLHHCPSGFSFKDAVLSRRFLPALNSSASQCFSNLSWSQNSTNTDHP